MTSLGGGLVVVVEDKDDVFVGAVGRSGLLKVFECHATLSVLQRGIPVGDLLLGQVVADDNDVVAGVTSRLGTAPIQATLFQTSYASHRVVIATLTPEEIKKTKKYNELLLNVCFSLL